MIPQDVYESVLRSVSGMDDGSSVEDYSDSISTALVACSSDNDSPGQEEMILGI